MVICLQTEMVLSTDERVFLVTKYAELQNITMVQRAWRSKFKNIKAPSYNTISALVKKFDLTGSVHDIHPKRAEFPAYAERRETLATALKELYDQDSSLSIRKAASAIQASYSLTRDIILYVLWLKPSKIMDRQIFSKFKFSIV